MNKQQYEVAIERLKSVNQVIEGLDPAIRADAFKVLEPYVVGKPMPAGGDNGIGSGNGLVEDPPDDGGQLDKSAYFEKYGSDRPGKNVLPIAGWIYARQGTDPFTAKQDIFDLAEEVGLVVSERPDKILRSAKDGSNKLFKSAGHGKLAPTVTGETHLRKAYGVKKPARLPLTDE